MPEQAPVTESVMSAKATLSQMSRLYLLAAIFMWFAAFIGLSITYLLHEPSTEAMVRSIFFSMIFIAFGLMSFGMGILSMFISGSKRTVD